MTSVFDSWWAWLSGHLLQGSSLVIVSAVSLAMLIASLILVPWFIVRLPTDHFIHRRTRLREEIRQQHYPRVALRVGKNILGGLLLLAGILMLALPGQGLLTILVAAILMDYPGKYRIERRILRVQGVKTSADWLRGKYGSKPFEL